MSNIDYTYWSNWLENIRYWLWCYVRIQKCLQNLLVKKEQAIAMQKFQWGYLATTVLVPKMPRTMLPQEVVFGGFCFWQQCGCSSKISVVTTFGYSGNDFGSSILSRSLAEGERIARSIAQECPLKPVWCPMTHWEENMEDVSRFGTQPSRLDSLKMCPGDMMIPPRIIWKNYEKLSSSIPALVVWWWKTISKADGCST